MITIERIQKAIDDAEQFKSKLSKEAIEVPFLGSLKIRALCNNLGALVAHFCEVGSHRGGSFCSTIYGNDNLISITAVDSWESDAMGEGAFEDFGKNTSRFAPSCVDFKYIISDCFSFDLKEIANKINLYSYDAGHSFQDQKKALTYYKNAMADEFIYCVDDYFWGDVREGTLAGIKEGGFDVIAKWELKNATPGDGHFNEEWWRGYGVFLLRK